MYRKICVITLLLTLSILQAYCLSEITGGWSAGGSGSFSESGISHVSALGGSDPSITLGVTSSSSISGGGTDSGSKTSKIGGESVTITVGGYTLTVSHDGKVQTSINGQGTGAATSFVGASVSGLSTGMDSYDVFGSADVSTSGYLYGSGLAQANASGTASYDGSRDGTPSEIWGEVSGSTTMKLEGNSANALASTGGYQNGLHTESRARQTINGTQTLIGGQRILGSQWTSSSSYNRAYGSVVNNSRATVTAMGTAQGGAWGPKFKSSKIRLTNEESTSTSIGTLWGIAETNADGDAADVSTIVQAAATTEKGFSATGGTGTYSAVAQTSSAPKAYATSWVLQPHWGSASRNATAGKQAAEWGGIESQGSTSQSSSAGTNALSFSVVDMEAAYDLSSAVSTGHMRIDTYSDATKNKSAWSSSIIQGTGNGTAYYWDQISYMFNDAKFEGGLYHDSLVDQTGVKPVASTSALLTKASIYTFPRASETLIQPFFVSTAIDPNVAWSRTEGTWKNPA